MSTTQVAATLFQLQQLDLELDRLTAEQQSITNSLQGNTTLQRLRTDFANAQHQLQSGLQTQKEAEWTLEDINQRLGLQEKRLYSGVVTNAKELQSLQQEVQRLRAQQSRQEEIVLEVIDAADSLQEVVDKKQLALKQAEEDWREENAKLAARCDQLELRRNELTSRRAQLTATIDTALVNRYDRMRKLKQGRAVSKVDQNACQWCRVILTPSELQQVRISSELQTCTNCGRILYYDR